jgi:hypothetical protein
MNSDYFMANILMPLIPFISLIPFIPFIPLSPLSPFEQAIFPRGRTLHQKRLVIHSDNFSVHASRASTDWLEKHKMKDRPFLMVESCNNRLERPNIQKPPVRPLQLDGTSWLDN